MSDEDKISLLEVWTRLAVLEERVSNMMLSLEYKHIENKNSMDATAKELKELQKAVWMLKIKIAGYAAGGGVLAQLVSSGVKQLLQHH